MITVVRRSLYFLLPLSTLFIWVPLQDPFNFPKFFIILIIGALALPLIKWKFPSREEKVLASLAGAFVVSLLLATLLSDVRFMSFFGIHGRNTGFLSYLALLSLFLFFVTRKNSENFYVAAIAFAVALSFNIFYSLLQHFGHDPIPWKNPFNPIVGTLGNPNFASSFLGMGAGFAFWLLLSKNLHLLLRMTGLVLAPLTFLIIWWSDSRQGLITYFVSGGVVAAIYLGKYSKYLTYFSLGSILLVLSGIALAIFNLGPLARFVYEGSLKARQSYWIQSLEMFRDHPLFGVGLDRFGAYFHQYRTNEDATNVLFNTTTDNAHNVVLHLLGTGGIFVALSYIGLFSLVAFFGVSALKLSDGQRRLNLALALGVWSAYQVQSLISIDQLGIALWNWVFAGVIVGEYLLLRDQVAVNSKSKTQQDEILNKLAYRSAAIAALIIGIFIVLVPQWKSEVQLRLGLAVENQPNNPAVKVNAMTYPVLNGFLESSYYYEMGVRALFSVGIAEDGQKFAFKTIQLDPRNYVAWSAIAELGEGTNQRVAAIPYRLKTTELDPNNPKVWVELMRDYKAAGKIEEARKAGERAIPLLTGFSMQIFKYDARMIQKEINALGAR